TLEAHHGVAIQEEALTAAVELSDLYLRGRRFPEKAITVLDEACARQGLRVFLTRPPDLREIDSQLEQLNRQKEAAVADQDFALASRLRDVADKLKKKKD